jgi:hypothetical protein
LLWAQLLAEPRMSNHDAETPEDHSSLSARIGLTVVQVIVLGLVTEWMNDTTDRSRSQVNLKVKQPLYFSSQMLLSIFLLYSLVGLRFLIHAFDEALRQAAAVIEFRDFPNPSPEYLSHVPADK